MTIQQDGKRWYILGTPYSAKDTLKHAGFKWDPDKRAWWIGKQDVAESTFAKLNGQSASAPSPDKMSGGNGNGESKAGAGDSQVVAGRVMYKGKTYYAAGRDTSRGRWDQSVDMIVSRAGDRMLLSFLDGSQTFWADCGAVQIVKRYDRPKTVGSIKRFIEREKSGQGGCQCDGRPGGYCCGRKNCQCYDCQ